jgi:hypothetical protein
LTLLSFISPGKSQIEPHVERTAEVCFCCSCKRAEVKDSLKHPQLWIWHELQKEFDNCLDIPTYNFVICILHAWQRIVEKQLTQTLKERIEAYEILAEFFKTLNKGTLQKTYRFPTKDMEFCGPFTLNVDMKCTFFSFLCPPSVLPLSSLCPPFVLPLSSLCPPFVLPLSSLCPPSVLPLSFLFSFVAIYEDAEEYESLKVGMLERKYAHLIVRTQSLWLPYLQQKLREQGIENFPITEEIQTVWSITEKV